MSRSILFLALLGIASASVLSKYSTDQIHKVAKRGLREYLERGFVRRDHEESGGVDEIAERFGNDTMESCLNGEEYGIELNVSDCEAFRDFVVENFRECYEEHEYDVLSCQVSAFICTIKEIRLSMEEEEEEEEERRNFKRSTEEEEDDVDCDEIATKFLTLAAGCALETETPDLFGCLLDSVECLMESQPSQNCTDFITEYDAYCDQMCKEGLHFCKHDLDLSPITCIGALTFCRQISNSPMSPGKCFGMYVDHYQMIKEAIMNGQLCPGGNSGNSGSGGGGAGGSGAGAGAGGGGAGGAGAGGAGGGGAGGGGAGSGGGGGAGGAGSGGAGSGGAGSGGAGAGGAGGGSGGGSPGASKREHVEKWKELLLARREKLGSSNKRTMAGRKALDASKRNEQKWEKQLLSRREMLDAKKAPTLTKLGNADKQGESFSKREELNRKKIELLRRILKELDLKK